MWFAAQAAGSDVQSAGTGFGAAADEAGFILLAGFFYFFYPHTSFSVFAFFLISLRFWFPEPVVTTAADRLGVGPTSRLESSAAESVRGFKIARTGLEHTKVLSLSRPSDIL